MMHASWRGARRGIALLVAGGMLFGPMSLGVSRAAAQTMVTLREGRTLAAEMVEDARSSAVAPGDEVRFRLLEDVEVHGRVALVAGTEGVLVVEAAKKNGMLGKAGQVVFTDGWVEAGGQRVPVRLQGRSAFDGKSKKTLAVVLTLVLVGPFIKGGQGGLAEGAVVMLEVTQTMQIGAAG